MLTLTRAKQLKKSSLRHAEYYDFQNVLDKLYQDSERGPTFSNLMNTICSSENIMLAYRNIKKNHGSKTAGVDKKTIAHLQQWESPKLIEYINKRLDHYLPQPVRRVEIPKANGKTRPLGIPTIMDRLIQQCVLQVLEPICEAKFYKRSNGFRPNRSTEHALSQCYKLIQGQHLYFVVDIDIKGFFDNVAHGKLLKQMWTLGIRDKKLLKIISVMLKAEVAGIGFPEKGTPQGGIISPLLSNIVLNELDWWVASQWETFPTRKNYKCRILANGTLDRSNVNAELRKSGLKECYLVRYADDFKIFCRYRRDAQSLFIATQDWLKQRLGLDISPEKSCIVNLKRQYSEFLGFKMKAAQKGRQADGESKYAVQSHISDKARKKIEQRAVQAVNDLKRPDAQHNTINRYNALVLGWHNYYRFATHVSRDFSDIAFLVKSAMKGKLKHQIKNSGNKPLTSPVFIQYSKSKELRFIGETPILPIAYVRHKNPIDKKRSTNSFTKEGRAEIHQKLQCVDMQVLYYLMRHPVPNRSVEYNDNRLSLYCAQMGKCAVLGTALMSGEMHCHHKQSLAQGGGDNYQNLILLDKDIHVLVHATRRETVEPLLELLKLDKPQMNKLNRLRSLLDLPTL